MNKNYFSINICIFLNQMKNNNVDKSILLENWEIKLDKISGHDNVNDLWYKYSSTLIRSLSSYLLLLPSQYLYEELNKLPRNSYKLAYKIFFQTRPNNINFSEGKT
jgi:hypothetical protein